MIKILFVCHGNICRSTMAQSILTHLLHKEGLLQLAEIDSAAVSREELGNDMYPPAKAELRRRGVPIVPHHARQVTRADYEHYDVLVCMDNSNLRLLPMCIGTGDRRKVRRLMDYTDRPGEVSNPWYSDRFDIAFDDITAGCNAIAERIRRGESL